MTVYIDVLIILNLYITYFTLKAAARLTHGEIPFPRLAAASVLGGIGSLLSLTSAGPLLSLAIKAALVSLTALVAFGAERGLGLKIFLCVAVSAVVCGAVQLLHGLIGTDFLFSLNGSVYMDVSALVLVAATAAAYGALTLLRRVFDGPSADSRVTLEIEREGRSVSVSALPDSGNALRDFLSGTPVIVCRADALAPVMPESLSRYLDGGDGDLHGVRLIPIRTANGTGMIAAFRPDRITARVGNGSPKRVTALVGTDRNALCGESFDAVINPKLLI